MNGGTGTSSTLRLDGNAAAGLLGELFARDVTAARATCKSCGAVDSVGALHMYAREMGAVLRCPGCDGVVLRMTRTPTDFWLDASGARSIVIPMRPVAE
jgi:hypothetical protein